MTPARRLRTYARLGPANIGRVASYRLGLKTGLHPVRRIQGEAAEAPFFRDPEKRDGMPTANTAWDDTVWRFGWHRTGPGATPPDWFANPFSDAVQPNAARDWWDIADFGSGDIKGLWELSRLDWVVAWATTSAQGDVAASHRLKEWLTDWALANPAYKGPNWKCGQEAAIRVMHLVVAAWVLGQDRSPEPGLVQLLIVHLQRIAPTMSYAIGQQNNHGTSEAAALFIGGNFLAGHDPRADAWAAKGRRWLEERARTLIEPDGSFSQYSVTYHRVMLDSYALAEAWRRHRGLPRFSRRLSERLASATAWLEAMTDRVTGDAPNIGANDGARLLQLTGSDYRDFRPSVQLAAALFPGRDAFGPGPWTAPLHWLDVPDGEAGPAPGSVTFPDGGYHVLRTERAWAVLRFPRFRFRPSQADALHLDLWVNGVNLLRDAGTFSYNSPGAEWFAGTAAHNTVTFDGRDQMPRLGRFLFADWVRAEAVKPVAQQRTDISAAAGYTDRHGARHHRTISLSPTGLTCQDQISGDFRHACLRWRLAPGNWGRHGDLLRDGSVVLSIDVDGASVQPELGTTEESRYYLQRSEVPLAWIDIDRPATLTTKVTF